MKKYLPIVIWVIFIFLLINTILFLLGGGLRIEFIIGFACGVVSILSIHIIIINKTVILEWFYVENKKHSKLENIKIIDNGIVKIFADDFSFLSNSYPSSFIVDGITFLSVEQYYHFMKTTDKKQQQEMLNTDNPDTLFKLGRKCILKKDWTDLRLKIMKKGITSKFVQNKQIQTKLITTKGYLLENGNITGDLFWGVNILTGKGDNNLGIILMNIRDKMVT